MNGRTTSNAMIKINGITYEVGLSMEVAGTMWFFRKIVEGRETTRHFWTKQTLEKYLRTLPNKIIKREVLAMLKQTHGRAAAIRR